MIRSYIFSGAGGAADEKGIRRNVSAWRGHRVRLAAVLLAIGACTTLPRAPAGPMTPHLVVPGLEHDLRVNDLFYRAEIPFRYTNQTGDTLVFAVCNPPRPPVLEWWDGTRWREAFQHIELDCLSSPFVIPPGTVIHDTLNLRVSRDSLAPNGHRAGSYWLASRDGGEYRLVWPLRTQGSLAERAAYRGGPLRPESERVSNTFRLRPRREAAPQN